MKISINRGISALFIGVFALVMGVAIQPVSVNALAAKGGGTNCVTSTISGLRGTYTFCSAIYQDTNLKAQPYGRLYLPSTRDDETKLEIQVRYCNTTSGGTSCSSLAGTNPTQTYNVTWIYNNGSCNSLIRGGTVTNGDLACQTSAITGGQSTVAGKWYLAQSRVILNGTVVKTVNSPALMAGN